MTAGERVRQARLQQGWSQEYLADRSGVPQSTVSRLESGGGVSVGNLTKIAEALNMDLNELLGTQAYPDLPEDLAELVPVWRSMSEIKRKFAKELVMLTARDFEYCNELALAGFAG